MPYSERPRSEQYRRLLREVLREGEWVETRQGIRAKTSMQKTMAFALNDGFPVITERDLGSFWRTPINELCAFINGATTLQELESFGCRWWGPWATEKKTVPKGLAPGSLGPGSYGGAFRSFPMSNGETFDQFAHLVQQITEFPGDRTHFVSPWIPYYLARGGGRTPSATIAPCHGWVHVRVLNGHLHLHMFQRSGDVPVGVPSNLIQYAALQLMLGHLTGFEPGTYYHTISDAHIYEDQVPSAEKMASREVRALPTVRLTDAGRSIADVHEFRGEHFELLDYHPHEKLQLPPAAV
jgi:thymidylate synthase